MTTDHDMLVRLDEKVDYIVKTMEDGVKAATETHKDYETRIRSLEASREQLIGKQGLMGAIIGGGIGFLGNIIGNLPNFKL